MEFCALRLNGAVRAGRALRAVAGCGDSTSPHPRAWSALMLSNAACQLLALHVLPGPPEVAMPFHCTTTNRRGKWKWIALHCQCTLSMPRVRTQNVSKHPSSSIKMCAYICLQHGGTLVFTRHGGADAWRKHHVFFFVEKNRQALNAFFSDLEAPKHPKRKEDRRSS